jgi:hypothetical protein
MQHAALLLLLLISDIAVLVLPSEAVPPALLELLHVLDTVYKAILKQLHGRQQQDAPDGVSGLAQLLKSRPQPVQLHIAMQVTSLCLASYGPKSEPPQLSTTCGSRLHSRMSRHGHWLIWPSPTHDMFVSTSIPQAQTRSATLVHIEPHPVRTCRKQLLIAGFCCVHVLQASAQHAQDPHSWPAAAAAAVQQAEVALIKCKAAVLSPALLQQQQQQQQQQGGASQRSRTASSSSSSRRGLLFELAGVHCCCLGGGPNTAPAKRRVSSLVL